MRLRRRKWEVLEGCESRACECIYQCLKMCCVFGCVDWLGIVGTACKAGCVYVKIGMAGAEEGKC